MDIDDFILPVVIAVCIVGVLAVILVFGDLYGGEWSDTAKNEAGVVAAIVVFALILAGIVKLRS
jgi:di/tricarboxylate transporter